MKTKFLFYLKIFFLLAATLFLSFSAAWALETEKIKYFVGQKQNSYPFGSVISMPFNFELKEDIDDVEKFKTVLFEISGVSSQTAALSINVSIDQISQDPTVSPRALTYFVSTLGKERYFKIFYDATAYFNSIAGIENPGIFPFVLNIKHNGSTMYLWQATLTASYIKAPKYKTKGNVISSVFDTKTINGASFNSIQWFGNKNNGRVRMQFSSSDCENGASNPPVCDTNTWQFIGPDCTIGTYYEPEPETAIEIKCPNSHNNKRYFRYKIELCSKDCVQKGRSTPQVNDVIINWSE